MGRPVRVAIVDDDEAFRRALTRLLVTLGFDVWSCSSAEELLASADALDRDCVVLDVHLPRMNGIELRRTLATLRPALPVLLLTADPVLVNRPAALEGATCLEKTGTRRGAREDHPRHWSRRSRAGPRARYNQSPIVRSGGRS